MTKTQMILQRQRRRNEIYSKVRCFCICLGLVLFSASLVVIKTMASTNPTDWINDGRAHKVEATAYYNPNNNLTASGAETIEGETIAGAREWLGCICVLWDEDMNYIGMYDFTDTGYGKDGDIERGETVDIYMEQRSDAIQWGRQTVYIQVIKAEG